MDLRDKRSMKALSQHPNQMKLMLLVGTRVFANHICWFWFTDIPLLHLMMQPCLIPPITRNFRVHVRSGFLTTLFDAHLSGKMSDINSTPLLALYPSLPCKIEDFCS